jgi:hypothetical protein
MMKRQSFLKAEDATLAPGNQALILNWGTGSRGGTILLTDVVFVSSTLSSIEFLYVCSIISVVSPGQAQVRYHTGAHGILME